MKKIITVFIVLALAFGTLSCGGGGGSGSASHPKGENPGEPSIVRLLPSHYIAQTNASISLHARVLDGNGAPVRNENVTFTNLSEPFGVISKVLRFFHLKKSSGILSSKVVKTNNNGIATAKLTATTAGFATIQAEVNTGYGIIRDKKTVFFSLFDIGIGTPQPTLKLEVSDGGNDVWNEAADLTLFKTANDNQRTVRATVLDGFGRPVEFMTVFFSSDSSGEVDYQPSSFATTNGDGEAYVTMQVDPSFMTGLPRVLNIGAFADNGAADLVSLLLEPIRIDRIEANAYPTIVSPDSSNVTITAIVYYENAAPPSTTVNFTATCGVVEPFAQTTDNVAEVQFIAPSLPGSCDITASVGGVSDTVTVLVTTALMVQPATQTINGVIGGTATYTIYGGTAPYTITSNDNQLPPNPATVAASGDTFSVTVNPNTPQKTVSYTIRDNTGDTVNAQLVIGAADSLSVQPSTQSISGTTGGDAVFTIFGGAPGYLVFVNSANPAYQPDPASVAASGDTFTVHVPAGSPASSLVYTVRDTFGTTTTGTLTIVGGPGLAVQPSVQEISGFTGGTATFTVFGGAPGYTIATSNPLFPPSAASLGASGDSFTITVPAGSPTTDITCTVRDSLGQVVTATVLISGSGLAVLPSQQTISSAAAGTATFTIFGGQAGYDVFSNNAAFPPTPTTVPATGGTFTVNVPAATPDTNVTFTVRDQNGTTVAATLNIVAAGAGPGTGSLLILPGAVTVAADIAAQTADFAISGGTPPYITTSSDPTNAFDTAAGDGIFDGTPITVNIPGNPTPGTVTLTVYDSLGATTTASLTITGAGGGPGGPAALTLNPSSISVAGLASAADAINFLISGGTDPYNVISSHPGVIASPGVVAAGPPFTFTVDPNVVAASTAVTLTAIDSLAQTATATVTVTPATSSMTLSPTSIAVTTGTNVGFNIIGGTPNYSIYSSNTAIVQLAGNPLVQAGTTFTATAVSEGSATVTVVDNNGETATATVTVTTPSGGPLTVIPTTQTISNPVATTSTADFEVSGGTQPYTVFSSSPGMVSVVMSDADTATATVEAVPTEDTSVTITVYDDAGDSVTVTLVLNVLPLGPLTLTPSSVSVTGFSWGLGGIEPTILDDIDFVITGGTSPYSMFSDNAPIIWSQGLLGGSTFTVDPNAVGAPVTVTITVVDGLGATDTATVTVNPVSSSLALNPSALTTEAPRGILMRTLGGTPPYARYTSNSNCADLSSAGPTFSKLFFVIAYNNPGCAGSHTITVWDFLGETATSTITITGAPPTAALAITPSPNTVEEGNDAIFVISGGSGSYTSITSSNPDRAYDSVPGDGTFAALSPSPSILTVHTTTGGAATSTITVFDSDGNSVAATLNITVPPAGP